MSNSTIAKKKEDKTVKTGSRHVGSRVWQHQILSKLLRGDLGFYEEPSNYASHTLHAFAAKFPPQLPKIFIERLTKPGDIILDPMVGSGTTLVEAVLLNRIGIGFDIDPLALKLCRVKTTPIEPIQLQEAGQRAHQRAATYLEKPKLLERFFAKFDTATSSFIEYWFAPTTKQELAALVLAIEKEEEAVIREFLEVLFSSIIVTKSGGVSLARDLAHTRPHKDETKIPKSALEQFLFKLSKSTKGVSEMSLGSQPPIIQRADCRFLPLKNETVDCIVTSPPYANAIDYMRAHKFSLVWWGHSTKNLSELRAEYIGSERTKKVKQWELPSGCQKTVSAVRQLDTQRAAVLEKYLFDMSAAIGEMYRVLHRKRVALIVVGPSTMRGCRIETHELLAEIGEAKGFLLVYIGQRDLDRNRRMMPARFGNNGQSMIEQRMHEEFVVGLLKP